MSEINDSPKESDSKIRQAYAHFQRLMSKLMREKLLNPALTKVHWLSEAPEEQGHELHSPQERLATDEPLYNRYHRAFYLIEDAQLVREDLAELERVRQRALALSGLRHSPQLLYPPLYEGVELIRYKPQIGYDSHLREREHVLGRARAYLQEFKEYTASRYEPGRTDDPVLRARYEEIGRLETQIKRLERHDEDRLRERRAYLRVLPYLYFSDGHAEQTYLREVGLIASGRNIVIERQEQSRRRPRGIKQVIEPLISFGPIEVYSEREAAMARKQA